MERVYIAGKLNGMAVDYLKNVQNGYYDYDDYFDNNIEWLKVADAVFVCPGWEESKGTAREIEVANSYAIPVVYGEKHWEFGCSDMLTLR